MNKLKIKHDVYEINLSGAPSKSSKSSKSNQHNSDKKQTEGPKLEVLEVLGVPPLSQNIENSPIGTAPLRNIQNISSFENNLPDPLDMSFLDCEVGI